MRLCACRSAPGQRSGSRTLARRWSLAPRAVDLRQVYIGAPTRDGRANKRCQECRVARAASRSCAVATLAGAVVRGV